MGFVTGQDSQADVRVFDTFLDAQKVFEDPEADQASRLAALDYIIRHQEIYYVLDMLARMFPHNRIEDHVFIDFAFAQFPTRPRRDKDFEAMFRMLKSDNAYLRNAVITFLHNYGDEAEAFLERLLADPDRDIRIFAVNILGDVRFDRATELLRHFITREIAEGHDVNALMTAVDYLGELGSEEDIPLLEAVRKEFPEDPYVTFGVDLAIKRIRGEG
ncbi:HEAT repeat domain-containing protein [Sulfurivirga sp.]|uniref:HEAT repeat domain-containing protein n=1 Tax=Sulfurivirga sp. TaxID=2614236 RepID=UPI0025F6A615|nr:HEAT repeat domain-containing protein [Sulfurivirga sp.]